jgi:hypothetical protein
MAKDKDSVTLAQRMARFGMRKRPLKNVNVKANAELHLDPQAKRYAGRITHHKVKSAADLKRLVGAPPGAVGQNAPSPAQRNNFISSANPAFLHFPAVPLADPEQHAQLAAYLFGPEVEEPTTADKKVFSQLDKLIRELDVAVAVFWAADIHIEEGATLVVDPKIQTLFANAIIIEDNATLKMQSAFSQIDCVRLHFVHS